MNVIPLQQQDNSYSALSDILKSMDAMKQQPMTDEEIQQKAHRYGILDRAELNSNYNAERDARNTKAQDGALGAIGGNIAGVILSKLLNNSSSVSNVNSATQSLPFFTGLKQTQEAGQQQADKEYPNALKNYYEALMHFDQENEHRKDKNLDVDLEKAKMLRSSMTPEISYEFTTDKYGRQVQNVIDKKTGNILRSVPTGVQTGHNEVQKNLEHEMDNWHKYYTMLGDVKSSAASKEESNALKQKYSNILYGSLHHGASTSAQNGDLKAAQQALELTLSESEKRQVALKDELYGAGYKDYKNDRTFYHYFSKTDEGKKYFDNLEKNTQQDTKNPYGINIKWRNK